MMLIKIISRNRLDKIKERALIWFPVVREVWEFIISLENPVSWEIEDGEIQKVDITVEMIEILISQNSGVGSEEYNVLVAGSKEEKMSVSIKT